MTLVSGLLTFFGVAVVACAVVGLCEHISKSPGDLADRAKSFIFLASFIALIGFYVINGGSRSNCYGSGPTRICEGE